jgi:hypothetical protein
VKRTAVTLAVVCGVSCGGGTSGPPASTETGRPAVTAGSAAPAEEEEEGHAHDAPHGGSLVELGDEFAHLEVVLDGASGRLTVYVLDGEAERPVRLAADDLTMEVRLDGRPALAVRLPAVANALTGEVVGDSSQFQAEVPELTGVTAFSGTLGTVSVRGQIFSDVQFDYPATGH